MADKYLAYQSDGGIGQNEAVVVSEGASDAGKIPGADSTGRLDVTWLPVGVGADTYTATVAEALSAGDFVNCFSDAGTFSARKADNSNGRAAEGFVLAAAAVGEVATVYYLGETNTELSALATGGKVWLGTAGGVIAAPPAGSSTGILAQYLGRASSATELLTTFSPPVRL
jgi:hypothetical protein